MAGVDPAAVLAALGCPTRAERLERAAGGADTEVWRVCWRGAAYALRVLRAGQQARCRKESACMRAAGAAGLPAPRVVAEGAWRDRPALLTTWCAGVPLLDALAARPDRARSLGRAFGQAQARLHAVAPPPECGTEWLRAGGPAAEPVRPLLLRGGARAALLHLDYHPLNVLAEGGRITGIIDWANAAAGDPRADLARTATILHLDAAYSGLLPPGIVAAIGRFGLGWREGYAGTLRVPGGGPLPGGYPRAPELAPYYAWAAAAMAEDLAGRRDGAFLDRVLAWSARWARRAAGGRSGA